MTKLLSPTLLLLIFSLLCTTTSGQPSAPAQAPSESLGKYDGVTSLPNSSSADLLPSLHHYFWSAFSTGSSTFSIPPTS
ncbi:unnamed protein product, partial [Vitis vinifera]|uniref:Uncharacterized protein n=1 Tax=Vitis vinifera TaxID=29760 RepID=D7TQK0_VITVI